MKYAFAMAAVLFLSWSTPLAAQQKTPDNTLTAEEKREGWQLLFNGKDLSGWRNNNGTPIQTEVEDGALVPYQSGGYLIIHEKEFCDFLLQCDVRWENPECNSGIFFRVSDPSNPVHTGFEVQIMGGDQVGKHQMGAIYDLASSTKNASRPRGEWNHVEIYCKGPVIRVKINGELVSQVNTEKFDQPGLTPEGEPHKFVLDGKPRAVKDFAPCGYLGFQDHGHKVWYKNVKLLELGE